MTYVGDIMGFLLSKFVKLQPQHIGKVCNHQFPFY